MIIFHLAILAEAWALLSLCLAGANDRPQKILQLKAGRKSVSGYKRHNPFNVQPHKKS